MSAINASISKNYKEVTFKSQVHPNEQWSKLVDVKNECGIPPFLYDNIDEFTISWTDFLYLLREVKTENIEISYDGNIKNQLNIYERNLLFVETLPKKIIPTQKDKEVLIESLDKVGFQRILFDNQLRDLFYMKENPNSANFSVPGAGKTTVTLALNKLINKDKMLIFVPNVPVMQAWELEVQKCFLNEDLPEIIRLRGGIDRIEAGLEEISKNGGIGLITYTQILSLGIERLLREFLINNLVHLVLDESHKIKGAIKSSGKPSKAAAAILRISSFAFRKDILSGTPMPLNEYDLISQVEFLYPFCGLKEKIEKSHHSPGKPISGIFTRTTKGELDLPEVQNKYTSVEMSRAQGAFYELVVDHYKTELLGLPPNTVFDKARKAIVRIMRLSVDPYNTVKSIKNDSDSLSRFINRSKEQENALQKVLDEGDVSPKIQAALSTAYQIVKEGKQVLIWSQFVDPIKIMERELSDLNPLTLYGGTEDKEESINLFNEPDNGFNILIGNPQTGGEGVSLHYNCRDTIYLDRSYNAAQYLQSRDRTHRIGMDTSTPVNYYFIENTHPNKNKTVIDRSISHNLEEKITRMDKLLNDPELRQLALDELIGDDFETNLLGTDLEVNIKWLLNDA